MSTRTWFVTPCIAVLALAVQAALVVPVGAAPARPALVRGSVEAVPGTKNGGDNLPAVVVDDSGVATAVWRQVGRAPDGSGTVGMRAARRGIGGRWTTAQDLGCPGADPCAGWSHKVGVSATGAVTAAWTNGATVVAVRRPAGGPWGAPHLIAAGTIGRGSLSLAVARNGSAILMWEDAGKIWATQRPARGSWQPPVVVGPGKYPQVAVAPGGAAVAVFHLDDDWFADLGAARFVPGRGWSPWRWIGHGWGIRVAVGRSGRALAVWEKWVSRPMTYVIRGRRMTPDGVWRRRGETISQANPDNVAPVPVIDRAGAESVAYVHGYDPGGGAEWPFTTGRGFVARRLPGGAWQRTAVVDRTGWLYVRLLVNRDNDLLVQVPGGVALRPHGEGWSRSAAVRGTFAILPRGSALRVWWESTGLVSQRIHVQ